ncbi:hypothetical protein DFH09DRAFT_1319787 [Mycena vulgaris]|nr:hypothetical protein DFH09DRAFT_1319787 [Mycena vulgaris]
MGRAGRKGCAAFSGLVLHTELTEHHVDLDVDGGMGDMVKAEGQLLSSDGVGLFLCIFALRFADFVVSIFQTPAEVFVAITTVWAFTTIINARLHMRLEGLSLSRSNGVVIMFEEIEAVGTE